MNLFVADVDFGTNNRSFNLSQKENKRKQKFQFS